MPPNDLVLWKSKAHRQAEMIVVPAVLFPIGPTMRALLGDAYFFFYGIAAGLPLVLLVNAISARLAPRFGGEWITKAEQLRRVSDETAASPRWQVAMMAVVMTFTMVVGFLLIIDPLDDFGSSVGGAQYALGTAAGLSALAAAQALFMRRRLAHSEIREESPPAGHFWSQLRRASSRLYVAHTLATAVGTTIALQFDGTTRFTVFVIVALAISTFLGQLLLRRKAPAQLYAAASETGLRTQMLVGVALFGIPMGIFFGGLVILTAFDLAFGLTARIAIAAAGVVAAMILFALGGVAFGAFIYAARRTEGGPDSSTG